MREPLTDCLDPAHRDGFELAAGFLAAGWCSFLRHGDYHQRQQSAGNQGQNVSREPSHSPTGNSSAFGVHFGLLVLAHVDALHRVLEQNAGPIGERNSERFASLIAALYDFAGEVASPGERSALSVVRPAERSAAERGGMTDSEAISAARVMIKELESQRDLLRHKLSERTTEANALAREVSRLDSTIAVIQRQRDDAKQLAEKWKDAAGKLAEGANNVRVAS